MRYVFICLMILTSMCFATVDLTEINFSTVTSGTFDQSLRRWFDTLNTDITNAGGLFNVGTGRIFYVDSGAGGSANSAGTSAISAWPTLDDAFDSGNGLEADRGDIIHVLQGHNEDITAGGVTVDIAGVTVVGHGNGSLIPSFDYTAAGSTFLVTASDVVLINLRHRASVTSIVSGMVVSGDDVSIIKNSFTDEGDAIGTDEFLTALSVSNGADRLTISQSVFRAGAAGAVQAILLGGVSGFLMEDTDITGDYSVALIKNVSLADDVIVRRSLLFSGTMGGDNEINNQPALEMAEGTSGFIADNRIVCNLGAQAMRVADDMVFMNNYVIDTDGDEFSGTIEAGQSSPGGHETVSTISGHVD